MKIHFYDKTSGYFEKRDFPRFWRKKRAEFISVFDGLVHEWRFKETQNFVGYSLAFDVNQVYKKFFIQRKEEPWKIVERLPKSKLLSKGK